jgi:hypothetical protein
MIVNHSDVLQASKGLNKVNAIQQMGLSRMGVLQVPQNGWFIMEHPIKMDDLGYPHGLETTK